MTKYLINEQYDVDEANASKGFGKGEKREDYADAWKDTGNVVLVGMAGAGKEELGRLIAERTGLSLIMPASTDAALEALAPGGRVVILNNALVEDDLVQPLIHGAGKVFYLMADTRLLSGRVAERDGVEDVDALWREMSARLSVMEPVFYSVLHFIMQAGQTADEMLDDALEKIGY